MNESRGQTRLIDARGRATALVRSRVRIAIEQGPDAGKSFDLERGIIRIGSAPSNDVVLSDDAVSGRHAEIELSEAGFLLRDLNSTNGTFLGGYRIQGAFLKPGAAIRVGESVLHFEPSGTFNVPLGKPGAHGTIAGESLALREALGLLERYARGDQPVLIVGETGTGKELFARSLHAASDRREGPFEVFDCGAATPTLIEGEIFGHVAGAYTGATSNRAGAFERADRGTLFLDEIGELPIDLQPKLLRVLEERMVRRLGDTRAVKIDVRICAATHRDLLAMVAAGEFRQDLFYRLNVLRLEIPPLRQRREDIPLIARAFLGDKAQLDDAAWAMLANYAWPGNVRELKNVLLRAGAMADRKTIGASDIVFTSQGTRAASGVVATFSGRTYHDAKNECVDTFERAYLEGLLKSTQGNVTRAAEVAQVPRQTLHRLIAKHSLRGGEE
jgi:transcriptional regulator with PAS, ATPase and Fis domain